MDLRREKPSKNVEAIVYVNRGDKQSRRGTVDSAAELKSGRKDKIFHSKEFKKALNEIAVDYNKKIGSGKGNRIVKK